MLLRDPAFSTFYADYLEHHRHPANRALHLLAKVMAIACLLAAARERSVLLLLAAPVLAVAPCWLGHLWFEGNRPVSWTQPAASVLGTLSNLLRFSRTAKGPTGGGAAGGAGDAGDPCNPCDHREAGYRATGGDRQGRRRGRAYYSLLADLTMCGEMLTGKLAARSSSEPT